MALTRPSTRRRCRIAERATRIIMNDDSPGFGRIQLPQLELALVLDERRHIFVLEIGDRCLMLRHRSYAEFADDWATLATTDRRRLDRFIGRLSSTRTIDDGGWRSALGRLAFYLLRLRL